MHTICVQSTLNLLCFSSVVAQHRMEVELISSRLFSSRLLIAQISFPALHVMMVELFLCFFLLLKIRVSAENAELSTVLFHITALFIHIHGLVGLFCTKTATHFDAQTLSSRTTQAHTEEHTE